ncbi:MAG: PTS sugar transporter [Desulfarculales bacterium]|jgi:PTS system mannose-specific IIA component|nr:PTS sugar transporter [Desulfarculales bacterium]
MIGILVITHAKLGRELVNAAEFILGKIENTGTLSVEGSIELDYLRRNMENSIDSLQKGKGVLILTDMFGGTPNNIALAFLEAGKVEVVTGVNLPMLVKAATARAKNDLTNLARMVGQTGRGAISVAGEILAS